MEYGAGKGRVEVITNKGCLKLSLANKAFPFHSHSPASASASSTSSSIVKPGSPFAGLVICVTGLPKEAREQVKNVTERLGGHYSPSLHPRCTHLVVQSFGGRKLEHALNFGSKYGMFVVTLGWFVHCVRRNVRLSESLYCIKNVRNMAIDSDESHPIAGFAGYSCIPTGNHETKQSKFTIEQHLQCHGRDCSKRMGRALSEYTFYFDPDISTEMKKKIVEAAAREGATFVDKWYVGCKATHVVCEGISVHRYLGHASNLVSPLWVLKTVNDKHIQRLTQISSDLARKIKLTFENDNKDVLGKGINGVQDVKSCRWITHEDERRHIIHLAKAGVRNRRKHRMQTSQTPIFPITSSILLDSICWSISESPSSATIYTDSFSAEEGSGHFRSANFLEKADGKDLEASFTNFTRPLNKSEKNELIFKGHFLTILFPIDRFSEMGCSAKTFFSDKGFTCVQVLEHIYAFYQESISPNEVAIAIHSDCRHAEKLRSMYSTNDAYSERSHVPFKRIVLLGSCRSFEMLKRVNVGNSNNVYELLIRG